MASVATLVTSTPPPQEKQNGVTFDYKKGVKNGLDALPEMTKLPSEFVLPLEENPLSPSIAQVPLIDLNGIDGPPERRKAIIENLKSACEDWGFFMVYNHGIKESLIEELMKVEDEFFNLSLEEKTKYASNDLMSKMRYGTSLNTTKQHKPHWRDFVKHYGHPFEQSYHLWPLNPPKYKPVVKEYMEQVWELVMKLLGVMSESLGLEKDYIGDTLGEGTQILTANYYPPCPEPEKTLGLAAHSDHGALTILTQNGVNGLQIKHDDEWLAVDHVPGTLLCNIGDFLEIASNGKYKSIEHRAVVNNRKTRISIAIGHGAELTNIVQPAPKLVKEMGGTHYKAIEYREHMNVHFLQTIATRGKSALDTVKAVNKE